MSRLISYQTGVVRCSVVELDSGCGNAISKIWEGSILNGMEAVPPPLDLLPSLLLIFLFIVIDSVAIINVAPRCSYFIYMGGSILMLFIWGGPFSMAVENVPHLSMNLPNFNF